MILLTPNCFASGEPPVLGTGSLNYSRPRLNTKGLTLIGAPGFTYTSPSH